MTSRPDPIVPQPARAPELADRLDWSLRGSLTARILAVNIFALALLAAGFYYLDTYRTRLVDARTNALVDQLHLFSLGLSAAPDDAVEPLVRGFTATTESRLRLYGPDGRKLLDSFDIAPPTYALIDPDTQPWRRDAARWLDRMVDRIAGAPPAQDFTEPAIDRAANWPELVAARQGAAAQVRYRYAPDRTPMLSVAQPPAAMAGAPAGTPAMLLTVNARDITRTVRAERFRLVMILGLVTAASVMLSLFLARTVVGPLRALARAAVRVRTGRAREVEVPRLPQRRDEIGTLARALSDMTAALRERIDAGEQFAADVTHELKNPLASLRSALEALHRVDDPAAQRQLVAIASDDVRRLDRLVTDISEASRVTAILSRTHFDCIDMGALIESLLADRHARAALAQGDGANAAPPRLAFARPRSGAALVMGDAPRLERVINNVLDNALSFSPPGGLICVSAARVGARVQVRVDDDGPGIPADQRELVFNRFHSDRPETEDFGRHSGLGLAIAQSIVEGHRGTIKAVDREDGARGASILIDLPAAEAFGTCR